MRVLIILLFFSLFSWSQNKDLRNSPMPDTTCSTEFTINQLISGELLFKCLGSIENPSFNIVDFKIKFQGHPSIIVVGSTLNDESLRISQSLNIGSYIVIHDIKHIITTKNNLQKYKTIQIKIIVEEN